MLGNISLTGNDKVTPFPHVERDELPTRQQSTMGLGYAPPKPKLPPSQEYEISLAKEIYVELSQIPPEARDRVMGMVSHMMETYAPVEKDITPHPQGAPV